LGTAITQSLRFFAGAGNDKPHSYAGQALCLSIIFGIRSKAAGKRACPAKRVAKGFIKTTEKCNGKKILKRTIEIIDEDSKKILIGILRNPYGDIKDLPAKDTKEMDEDKLNSKTKDKSKTMESLSGQL
jgi:hypothetical protein